MILNPLKKIVLIICISCSFWCGQAFADTFTTLKPSLAEELLKQLDMNPSLEKDGNGNPYIVFYSDGYKAAMYFFDCDNQGCSSIQLFSSFSVGDIDLAHIDKWNSNAIFARAYLRNQQASLEADLNISGGITLDNFAAFLAYYTTYMPNYVEMLQNVVSKKSTTKPSKRNNTKKVTNSNKEKTISLAVERATESDVGCKISFGAYNLGQNSLPNLSVKFESTDISLNQKEVTFNFGSIGGNKASSQTQIIPQTNCWRVLDFKITEISGCDGSNCMEQTMMDLGGPIPISEHSPGIKFHGNPSESN